MQASRRRTAASVGRARSESALRSPDAAMETASLMPFPLARSFGRVREGSTSSGTNLPPIDFKIDSPTTIVVLKVGSPKS